MTESVMDIVLPSVNERKSLSVDIEPVPAGDTHQMLDAEQTRPVNITFYNISRRVRTGIGLRYKRDWKYILHDLSGQFLGGELTGIIGPSGAGKSTLMDILSGYTTDYERGGCIQVNGQDNLKGRQSSCYIMQNDQLQPLFTVQEAMICAAHLKLGSNVTHKDKRAQVNDILKRLNLVECKDKRTYQLSNGKRKLLAIALELVNNPPVMFFDEPTSGLDSWSSSNCLNFLKDLTCQGKTIICTIHQPSATLFQIFDHVYAIAQGHCVYQGSARGVVPFLASLDRKRLICPDYYNPADYMLDVCMGEYDDCNTTRHFDKLVTAIENGKKWISVPEGTIVDHKTGFVDSWRIQVNNILDHKKQTESVAVQSCDYPTSFVTQIYILVNRTFIKLQRDKFFTRLRIMLHIMVGALIGGLFCSIGRDAVYVFDNLSLLFFSLMFLMFTALSSMMMSFPSEMPIITREYFNRWYSLKSYYLALTIMDTPIQLVCVLCYCSIVYLASQQPFELFRFALFVSMCSIVSLVAQAMGFLVGVLMEIQNGVIFGPLTLLPWVVFSGYFLRLSDAPTWLQWLFHISFLKYGLEGLLVSIYGYERPSLSCSDDYCHFISPNKFLQEMEMKEVNYWDNFLLLFSLFIIIKVITFFVLRYQLSHKR